jgi:hypothetical protein
MRRRRGRDQHPGQGEAERQRARGLLDDQDADGDHEAKQADHGPTRTLSTPVAVEGEYRQAAGSETLRSSQMVSCLSSGPSSAPRIGRADRLPLSC